MAGLGPARTLCRSEALEDGGPGLRFEVALNGTRCPAFAVRHGGRVYAYLNRCAHLAVELDWNPGQFFDAEGAFLVCATHGARYHPHSGACAGGRCNGRPLTALGVEEADGEVRLLPEGEGLRRS